MVIFQQQITLKRARNDIEIPTPSSPHRVEVHMRCAALPQEHGASCSCTDPYGLIFEGVFREAADKPWHVRIQSNGGDPEVSCMLIVVDNGAAEARVAALEAALALKGK